MSYRYDGFNWSVNLRVDVDKLTGHSTGKVIGFIEWKGGISHEKFLEFGMSYDWPVDVDFTLTCKDWPGERLLVLGCVFTFTPRVPLQSIDWQTLGRFVRKLLGEVG